jgi:hypothetical protein
MSHVAFQAVLACCTVLLFRSGPRKLVQTRLSVGRLSGVPPIRNQRQVVSQAIQIEDGSASLPRLPRIIPLSAVSSPQTDQYPCVRGQKFCYFDDLYALYSKPLRVLGRVGYRTSTSE